jgi:Xaa-Pro aminopeptidase
MYKLLCKYLDGTPFPDRFISSEDLISLLRGRKLDEEIERITAAAILTNNAWHGALDDIAVGQTEIEIAETIEKHIARLGAETSFELTVNAGDKSDPGHGIPGTTKLAPGDLLHVDIGARLQQYCSDIQRLAYYRRIGESSPPEELIDAFNTVRDIITEAAALYRPGAIGHEIDAVARQRLRERGYPVYEHALGHQIGRSVHDGAAIVGPRWERYGRTPLIPLEKNNVFTVEFGIELDGIGYVGLEEDLVVTDAGGKFLCPRQMELIVI